MTRQWINDPRNKQHWPFVGVDGEGGNIPDPDALFGTVHRYLLLRAGDRAVENQRGLSFVECADFLCDLPERQIYVAFAFDYDVTMILRELPEERIKKLFDRAARTAASGGRNALPVDYGKYQFDYLPHKEFRIRKMLDVKDGKPVYGPYTIISDVFTFFQGSFLATLEKWNIGTEDERKIIAVGKENRRDFGFVGTEVRNYNNLEIALLEKLMREFRAVCVDVGYVPDQWQGPGWMAAAMFKKHGVPKTKELGYMNRSEFRKFCNDAYYGGRFETTAVGPILGTVYQYDINSAYPSVLKSLPCLKHGSWRRIRDIPDRASLWVGQVHFYHDQKPGPGTLYNLPIRTKDGNIQYPYEGIGIYWSTELEAAQAAGTTIKLLDGWEYVPHCECRWFDFIDDYYARRLKLGKSTKGIVLKLAGNSIYGKLAQSIGSAPYANPVWAGLITAGCRALIIRAYTGHKDHVYMIATDGLFMGERLETLPLSNKLGEWEETIHAGGIFIVQPGIYYLPGGDVKTRGVERGRISQRREDFESTWERFLESHGEHHTVKVEVDNFVSLRQAVQRRNWKLVGSWETTTRAIGYDWRTKRDPRWTTWDGRGYRHLPLWGSPGLVSVGYDRLIGGGAQTSWNTPRYKDASLVERQRQEEQPDWVDPLISGETLGELPAN